MPGRCRTTAASGRCGRSSASRPTSHKVPCFRGSLSRICGFSGFLPPAVSGVIFRNRGFPTFLLGEYPRGAPDSHKLPRRIWENRRASGNPGSSPALSTRHSSNPDFPCIHRRRQPPQHRQNLLPTLSSPQASAEGCGHVPTDTERTVSVDKRPHRHCDDTLSVGRRSYRH